MKCLSPLVALALATATSAAEVEDRLLTKLSERLHDVKIQSIRKLDNVELYEVVTSANRIFYTDPNAAFALTGDLIDLTTQANLSDQRREELNVVDFSSLPFDKAVIKTKGDGSRKLAIFVDPDCPYCQQLERELTAVSNVTIYIFLYPIASLHPDAARKARAIWCAEDRVKAWDELMLQGKEPAAAPDHCADPIGDIAQLADEFHIEGTPGLIFASGRMVPGVIPAQDIEALLQAPSKS